MSIPNNDNTINNLYAVDVDEKIFWQSENLKEKYTNVNLLPYEQMVIDGKEIRVADFYGRRYFINIDTGKIIKKDIVK